VNDAVMGERDFRDFSRLLPAKENRTSRQTPTARRETPEGERIRIMSTNVLDGSTKNKEMESVLLKVIESLEDGQKGFAEIGEHLKDEQLKRYFLAESLKRANFRGELENELHRAGMADVKEGGSVSGAVHRAWGELKAKLGGGDHTLLVTAEQGEDEAKKAYKDALEQELPLPIRQLLSEQQAHVMTSHDYVRNHRDALAAK
jgi:uncharacterized protein (TIGR02284 family)